MKCPRGFVVQSRHKAGEWGLNWAQTSSDMKPTVYIVQLHLVTGGIVVQIVNRTSKLAPMMPHIPSGTPLVLLPALTPSYYLGMLKPGATVSDELWSSLAGHGYVRRESEELVVCWSPIPRSHDQDIASDHGVCCVWPRSLCMVSTIREVNKNLPSLSFTTFPITKTQVTSTHLTIQKSEPKGLLRSSNAPDLRSSAQRASTYIDAVVRSRERVRDIQRPIDPLRPSSLSPTDPTSHPRNGLLPPPTQYHQLYPSPPGASPDNVAHDPILSSQIGTSRGSSLMAPDPSQPNDSMSFGSQSNPWPSEQYLNQSGEHGGTMHWADAFDSVGGDDLDDYTQITDDVFNFFDSPPAPNAPMDEPVLMSAVAEPRAYTGDFDPLEVLAHVTQHSQPSSPSTSQSSVSFPVTASFVRDPTLSPMAEPTSEPDGFSAILVATDVRHPMSFFSEKGFGMDHELASFGNRYRSLSDPRVRVVDQLRALKLNQASGSVYPIDWSITPLKSPPDVDMNLNDGSSPESNTTSDVSLPDETYAVKSPNTDTPNTTVSDAAMLSETTSFALFTQSYFDSSWLPVHGSDQIDSTVNPADAGLVTKSPHLMYVLSIPTPVSPGGLVQVSEREDVLRTIIPLFTSDCVEGGLWPNRSWHTAPTLEDIPSGFGSIISSLLGPPVDLASIITPLPCTLIVVLYIT